VWQQCAALKYGREMPLALLPNDQKGAISCASVHINVCHFCARGFFFKR